jgi:hypothetical protein
LLSHQSKPYLKFRFSKTISQKLSLSTPRWQMTYLLATISLWCSIWTREAPSNISCSIKSTVRLYKLTSKVTRWLLRPCRQCLLANLWVRSTMTQLFPPSSLKFWTWIQARQNPSSIMLKFAMSWSKKENSGKRLRRKLSRFFRNLTSRFAEFLKV